MRPCGCEPVMDHTAAEAGGEHKGAAGVNPVAQVPHRHIAALHARGVVVHDDAARARLRGTGIDMGKWRRRWRWHGRRGRGRWRLRRAWWRWGRWGTRGRRAHWLRRRRRGGMGGWHWGEDDADGACDDPRLHRHCGRDGVNQSCRAARDGAIDYGGIMRTARIDNSQSAHDALDELKLLRQPSDGIGGDAGHQGDLGRTDGERAAHDTIGGELATNAQTRQYGSCPGGCQGASVDGAGRLIRGQLGVCAAHVTRRQVGAHGNSGSIDDCCFIEHIRMVQGELGALEDLDGDQRGRSAAATAGATRPSTGPSTEDR